MECELQGHFWHPAHPACHQLLGQEADLQSRVTAPFGHLKSTFKCLHAAHARQTESMQPISLSLSHKRGASALRASSWPFSGPFPKDVQLFLCQWPQAGHSTPNGASSEGQFPSWPCWPPLF